MVYEATPTADGTPTFWHPVYREHYHSRHGALREAQQKFVDPSELPRRLGDGREVALLDIGFGLSYNSYAAASAVRAHPTDGTLSITALELDRGVVHAALEALPGTMPAWWLALVAKALACGQARDGGISLSFLWGDARATIGELAGDSMELVYHDPFSTQRTPQLWTQDFFVEVRRRLRSDGCLLTYSQAPSVRHGLEGAGFTVGYTPCSGTMRDGTTAKRRGTPVSHPLTSTERTALGTAKGEPYRDVELRATASAILRERQGRVDARRG